MDLTDAIYGRRAVRDYTDQPLGTAEIEALIDAAIQAPSAMNRQPWAFCVVTDQQLLQRISDAAKAHLLQSPALPHGTGYEAMLGDPAFHIFYHAPALILICATEEGPWSRIDCALAAQNLMLAARSAGLGSCWIGFAQDWLATPQGKAALALPADLVPVAPIIIGHPKVWPAAVPRHEPNIVWSGARG